MRARRASYLQYLGAGATKDCIQAIEVLLQSPMGVREALLLSHKAKTRNGAEHGFLLKLESSGDVVIPPGFTSGYSGEGPRGLSFALALFESFGMDVAEVWIGDDTCERLESMQLTNADVAKIRKAPPRSAHANDYLFERHYLAAQDGRLWWRHLDPIIPLVLVAPPLADLVPTFRDNPDHALMTGYRRLEDNVRKMTGLKTSSTKLISDAFLGNEARLKWSVWVPEILTC